jgi:hypothetical protein
MNFSEALTSLKSGNLVYRKGWNGKDMFLGVQIPDENSKMTMPYIYMETSCGNTVPWLASQTDILSDDWKLFAAPDNEAKTFNSVVSYAS